MLFALGAMARSSRFFLAVPRFLLALITLALWIETTHGLAVATQQPPTVSAQAVPPVTNLLRGMAPAVCNGGTLGFGNGQDLQVTGQCLVKGGNYNYHNVNIFTVSGAKTGGSLIFADAPTRFYAESILVEAGGSLIAGTPQTPIGTAGGPVEIHLWGKATDPGIVCQSPPPPGKTQSTCGVPLPIWNSNRNNTMFPSSCNTMTLGNGVSDCFYQYEVFDNNDVAGAYFGHKVLAVSYGGTLQLFGKKGATICNKPGSPQCTTDADPSKTGTSWGRLSGSVKPGGTTLTLDRNVDWQPMDQIVLTTTDYLTAHSERLTIGTVSGNTITLSPKTPVQYPHNGQSYDLVKQHNVPAGKGPDTGVIDTRAAVALLTRSIKIVSEGDTIVQHFDDKPFYYFGGHTIARQGFNAFQVQGVEFKQLGQGGSKGHYAAHFHMVRQAPPNTFIKDSSVYESMTRWYTIHASSHIQLSRNVGYRSIGHGYYLEDGTETDNKIYGNIGIEARTATASGENPRQVPGILVSPDFPTSGAVDGFGANGYHAKYTDAVSPAVFWIMNGWNDFQYNMAVGAGGCGTCYWFVPGAVSGPSMTEFWTGYAGEQSSGSNPPFARAGMTPMKEFYNNTCVAAMSAFQTVGLSTVCNGIEQSDPNQPFLKPLISSSAPTPGTTRATLYYPNTANDRYPTFCSGAQCNTVNRCEQGHLANCAVTILDHFTSSFNWAQENFSAIWLRINWYLLTNSAVTDTQNGGVTFVTGGGYTDSDAPTGYWGLAKNTAFVGNTQPCSLTGTCANPFASNAGPFNPVTAAWKNPSGQPDPLQCAPLALTPPPPNPVYPGNVCLDIKHDITMQLSALSINQRLFNIYDGPSYQDSNAYLDINVTPLNNATSGKDCMAKAGNGNPCPQSQFMNAQVPIQGIPQATSSTATLKPGQCYLPNAAIAWKQPNGFFYPPAFRSTGLFFNNVDIRHFVIEPLFDPTTSISFSTDYPEVQAQYCTYPNNGGTTGLFSGFTDVDRQTVLLDNDGSLTGLTGTTSVNEDPFFNAPVQTAECRSNVGVTPVSAANATAKTSPYEYVSTAIYPDCAINDTNANNSCNPPWVWDQACSTPQCYGVPLYRELLIDGEKDAVPIRLMGQSTYQRSSLTVNNGQYYIDTTVDQATQRADVATVPPGLTCQGLNNSGGPCFSVFKPNQKLYVYLLFAKPDTVQTYDIYVGNDFNPSTLSAVQVDPASTPYTVNPVSSIPSTWTTSFMKGILTVKMDMSFPAFQAGYDAKQSAQCQPASFCVETKSGVCTCNLQDNINDPYQHGLYEQCTGPVKGGPSPICKYGQADVKCPAGGCYGFTFTLPATFSNKTSVPPPVHECLNGGTTDPFDIPFAKASSSVAGSCFYSSTPQDLFCTSGTKR